MLISRLELAVSKGCDGVEPDNVDGYMNPTGFPLSAQDQIDFNTFLSQQAHSKNLAVALKNDIKQITILAPIFGFRSQRAVSRER
ncbi:endo alpha-1,4 polygalactosaminidase [Paraburkholderia sp. MPAMCS5]|uniref:endo alpha-1,4 polygalactosaminidase n=1 Tax=Paraburkholderia sp. MPAMCS5 TaxID=3112563 RepID=UPI002E19ED8F|nr:endo alpha-1,4 polygalactosaminidase [Paraburkholderia sp. MPAMCS5]